MDNDPSQSSKATMKELKKIEAELLKIPAISPDLNPIENMFHIVKSKLRDEAIDKRKEAESFWNFRSGELWYW